jgi:hypothetical protein
VFACGTRRNTAAGLHRAATYRLAGFTSFLVVLKKDFFGGQKVPFLKKPENGREYWLELGSLFEKGAKINIVSILP